MPSILDITIEEVKNNYQRFSFIATVGTVIVGAIVTIMVVKGVISKLK